MYDLDELAGGLEATARLYETLSLDRSPFHLDACGGCGAPCFQQPCSLCRYYPRGTEKGTWNPKVATKAMFCDMIERSGPDRKDGTLATWYISAHPGTFHMMEQAISEASLLDVPPASDYWDAIVVDGHGLHREQPGRMAHVGWRGLFELKAVIRGHYGNGDGIPQLSQNCAEVARNWVAAVHAGDSDRMVAVSQEAMALASRASDYGQHVGNLRMAQSSFSQVEEHSLPPAIAP